MRIYAVDGAGNWSQTVENDNLTYLSGVKEAGNVFYLVVDKQRDSDNVYFLNSVTEYDLKTLAEPAAEKEQESVSPEEPDMAVYNDYPDGRGG